jgi:hypothetical protein
MVDVGKGFLMSKMDVRREDASRREERYKKERWR